MWKQVLILRGITMKRETIKVMNSIEKSLSDMEKFNPYQTGTGIHVSEKYKKKGRKKEKERKEMKSYES